MLERQIAEARRIAQEYTQSEAKLDSDLRMVMKSVYDLEKRFISFDGPAEPLRSILKQENIRITGNTRNTYTPLFKLVARDLPRTTISRSAAVLAYAQANETELNALDSFIAKQGGIVKCAKAASDLGKPKRSQRRAERSDEHLKLLRQTAKDFPDPFFMDDLPEGLSCCLLEKRGKKVIILSIESEKSSIGYTPFLSDNEPDF